MIRGFRIGHFSDFENLTGCSVVLAPPEGAVGGVDVRGPAPGTRETELLRTGHLIERAHAILLTGGSAFGLDAATGVMRYLEQQNIGYDTGIARVPIVAAAVLFDLGVGNAKTRPNAEAGYAACLSASETNPEEGSVGAGTGATVGKLFGSKYSSKSGMGYAARELGAAKTRVHVSAFVVTNAFGDVIDPNAGTILAGTRNPNGNGWLDTADALQGDLELVQRPLTNTTLGVVMTDAPLNTEEANIVAMMAQTGVSRATRPAHSMYDGDTVFVLASGMGSPGNLTAIGHAAAECVAEAIGRGVKMARSLGGVRKWDE
jgi:L-aminopeptidase/D-esterase-like protein